MLKGWTAEFTGFLQCVAVAWSQQIFKLAQKNHNKNPNKIIILNQKIKHY